MVFLKPIPVVQKPFLASTDKSATSSVWRLPDTQPDNF